MKGVGTDIGTIHFIGIGGIGMSGIAEVMHNLGYSVQGSDVAEGYVVEGLRAKGIKVTELEQFPAAVREAVAANSPVLIDVDGAAAQAMDRPRTT